MGCCTRCLPLEFCLCCHIKTATFTVFVYITITATLAALFEVLDIAALNDDNFEIKGGFRSAWRAHVWEGWLACNIVTLLCHFIMIWFSIVLMFAVKRFSTYYEYYWMKAFLTALIMYILIELGTGLFRYSWYGPNTFRLGYLVWTFIYWSLRTILNVVSVLVIYSRLCELWYVMRYGEQKGIGAWNPEEGGRPLDTPLLMSGAQTPMSPL